MDGLGFWALQGQNLYVKEARPSGNVSSVEQFHAILEREKARVERNAHQFSLILFELARSGRESVFQGRYLTDSLVNRIRWTDEAGWYDNRHIGIILPDTSVVGAHSVAGRICKAITSKIAAPVYTVYTYPSESLPNGNGHYKQLSFIDICSLWESESSRKYLISTDVRYKRNNPPVSKQLSTEIVCNEAAQSAEIEPFFCQMSRVWKRAFDIMFSMVALIILSPLFLFVSMLIKVVSKGPVFFKQKRVGYNGKTFIMWKFRTMEVNTDVTKHKRYLIKLINDAKNTTSAEKPMIKLNNCSEWIRFGWVIRKMCIDELPQLINVLCGNMSLVGPRPALSYEVEEYLPWHYRRFDVIPGMTGLWQVSGKNRLSFNEMVRLDIRYSREVSFWLDVKILLKTPFAIIFQIIDDINETKATEFSGVEKCLTLQ